MVRAIVAAAFLGLFPFLPHLRAMEQNPWAGECWQQISLPDEDKASLERLRQQRRLSLAAQQQRRQEEAEENADEELHHRLTDTDVPTSACVAERCVLRYPGTVQCSNGHVLHQNCWQSYHLAHHRHVHNPRTWDDVASLHQIGFLLPSCPQPGCGGFLAATTGLPRLIVWRWLVAVYGCLSHMLEKLAQRDSGSLRFRIGTTAEVSRILPELTSCLASKDARVRSLAHAACRLAAQIVVRDSDDQLLEQASAASSLSRVASYANPYQRGKPLVKALNVLHSLYESEQQIRREGKPSRDLIEGFIHGVCQSNLEQAGAHLDSLATALDLLRDPATTMDGLFLLQQWALLYHHSPSQKVAEQGGTQGLLTCLLEQIDRSKSSEGEKIMVARAVAATLQARSLLTPESANIVLETLLTHYSLDSLAGDRETASPLAATLCQQAEERRPLPAWTHERRLTFMLCIMEQPQEACHTWADPLAKKLLMNGPSNYHLSPEQRTTILTFLARSLEAQLWRADEQELRTLLANLQWIIDSRDYEPDQEVCRGLLEQVIQLVSVAAASKAGPEGFGMTFGPQPHGAESALASLALRLPGQPLAHLSPIAKSQFIIPLETSMNVPGGLASVATQLFQSEQPGSPLRTRILAALQKSAIYSSSAIHHYCSFLSSERLSDEELQPVLQNLRLCGADWQAFWVEWITTPCAQRILELQRALQILRTLLKNHLIAAPAGNPAFRQDMKERVLQVFAMVAQDHENPYVKHEAQEFLKEGEAAGSGSCCLM